MGIGVSVIVLVDLRFFWQSECIHTNFVLGVSFILKRRCVHSHIRFTIIVVIVIITFFFILLLLSFQAGTSDLHKAYLAYTISYQPSDSWPCYDLQYYHLNCIHPDPLLFLHLFYGDIMQILQMPSKFRLHCFSSSMLSNECLIPTP
jgi:hypothetical protein